MTTLEKATTTVTESAMTIAGSSLEVTASAEQIPSICTMMGLFLLSGPRSVSLFFLFQRDMATERYRFQEIFGRA